MKRNLLLIALAAVSVLGSCKKEETQPKSTTNTNPNTNTCDPDASSYYVFAYIDGSLVEYPTKHGLSLYTDAIDKQVLNVVANDQLVLNNTEIPGWSLWISCGYPPEVGVYDARCCVSQGSYFEWLEPDTESGGANIWVSVGADSTESQIEITSVSEFCEYYVVEGTFFSTISYGDSIPDRVCSNGEFRIIL